MGRMSRYSCGMKAHPSLLLAIGLVLGTGTLARAQTPPIPPPPPATREATHATASALPDFSGTWTIDRTYSNDPAQANFGAAPGSAKQGGQTHGGSGGRGGFGGLGGFGHYGGSGGGNGGNSGGRSRNDASGGTTPDEQARLAALTDELKKGASTLTISHHDPSFVVTNGLEHAVFCQTSGETQEQYFGDLTIPTVTNWEGDRIVTEFDLSSRRHLIYTYTLLENTKQLVLRVHLEDSQGSRGNGAELKLVYRMSISATK